MNKWFPHLGMLVVYVLWGINVTSMKVGGHEWDPLVFNGIRYASLIPFLWLYTMYYYKSRNLKLTIATKDLWIAASMGFISAVGMESVMSYALQFSNTANGAVLGRGFMPVITVIFAIMLRDIRITWRVLVGIPLAFVSVIVIVMGNGFHMGSETMKGDMLLLLRSFFGAVYLIGMNRLILKYPLLLLITIEITAGALFLLPYLLWKVDVAAMANMSMSGWLSLTYTTIFATLIGFTLHNWCLGKLGPVKSSVYGYFMPVTAAIAGVWLLHETITLNQYIGGAGVILAMYLVQRDRMQNKRVEVDYVKGDIRTAKQSG